MSLIRTALARLEQVRGLDPAAEALAGAVQRSVPGPAVADALHGVWLGHPVHPLIVQVPLGAWLSAAVLDALPGNGDAARRLVGLGLLASPVATAAGLADWAELEPEQRRVGLVHAAANALATGGFTASYLARRRGRNGLGALLGMLGLAVAGVGGALGGHLTYAQAAGANHAEGLLRQAGTGWHDLGPLDDLPLDTPVARTAGSVWVVVCRRADELAVLVAACSHVGGPLYEGRVVNHNGVACVECPWHAARFALADGTVLRGPATAAQPSFETRVVAGRVHARAHAEGSHWTVLDPPS